MNRLRGFVESLGNRRRGFKRLAIVLAVNAVVFVAVTYRLGNKQERLSGELERLSFQLEQKRQELESVSARAERAETNARLVEKFWEETVQSRAPGLTEAWNEIDRLASETGVVRGRTGYDRELLDVGLEQVQATMPVEGDYFDLVRFINRLERSDRFFLVQQVQLTRREADASTIHLDCNLAFYLKPLGTGGDGP